LPTRRGPYSRFFNPHLVAEEDLAQHMLDSAGLPTIAMIGDDRIALDVRFMFAFPLVRPRN
jgi:hypothetical protein